MAAASPRATFSGSSLVRLLSGPGVAGSGRLEVAPVRETGTGFAERLGSWLDWTDAIALSAALGGEGPQRPSAVRAATAQRSAAAGASIEACQRVRSDLVKLATADVAYTAGVGRDGAGDFSPYRRDYLAHQRAMESAIATLRAQLRIALASVSAEGARLATLDAVMDEALRPRERQLLATVPAWLERQFEGLQQAHTAADESATEAPAFHHRYHREMQRVLLAELDLRLEPVEGLLAALREETTR